MSVSVLVPWRGGDPHRQRAWTWVRDWWTRTHPGWQVVEGCCPDGPWRKALAVADALSRATGDVLVLADADVFCRDVSLAVDATNDGAGWAIPHRNVHRLAEQATTAVLGGEAPSTGIGWLDRRPYLGVAGGGMVVLRRETYERVPLDPRFVDWGQDDEAHGAALTALVGRPWRGTAVLWHMWHPPAERLNRHVGNAASWALYVRYRYAARDRSAMRALLAEFQSTTEGQPLNSLLDLAEALVATNRTEGGADG